MEECIYCNEMRVNLRADGMCKACADGDLRPDERRTFKKPHQIRMWDTFDRCGRVDQGGPSSTQWEFETMYHGLSTLEPKDFKEIGGTKEISEYFSDRQMNGVKVRVKREFDEMAAYGPLRYRIRKMKEKRNEVRINYQLNRFHKKKQEVTAR